MPCAFGTARQADLVAAARAEPGTEGQDLVAEVTTASPYEVAGGPFRVVAYDFGIKRSILAQLAAPRHRRGRPGDDAGRRGARPATRRRVPVERSRRPGRARPPRRRGAEDSSARSRSSGSASATSCSARALGGSTYKLALRPPRRQPPGAAARDRARSRSRARTTATPSSTARSPVPSVTHVNLNDGVIEGLACRDIPAFSVQYHPEAGPGPHDAALPLRRVSPPHGGAPVSGVVDEVAV